MAEMRRDQTLFWQARQTDRQTEWRAGMKLFSLPCVLRMAEAVPEPDSAVPDASQPDSGAHHVQHHRG